MEQNGSLLSGVEWIFRIDQDLLGRVSFRTFIGYLLQHGINLMSMTNRKKPAPDSCDPATGCCSRSSGIDRRAFLKSTAAGASLLMIPGMPIFAGQVDENDYLKYIPADKKLDPTWVQSLFERGSKETYTDPVALDQIGMPVGGLFAGTVYLSGDGRLWLWDIFNRDQEGILPKTIEYRGQQIRNRDGSNYVEPARVWSPFKQGFELIIGKRSWPLDRLGFESVEFEGRYPMGIIRYRDPECPVEVTLEAFSPFIPGNAAESSLPATILRYRIRNLSEEEVTCALRGFTENPVCIDSAKEYAGYRRNRVKRSTNFTTLICEAQSAKNAPKDQMLDELRDFGTFCLTIFGEQRRVATATVRKRSVRQARTRDLQASLMGSILGEITLPAGDESALEFAFTWHFPNFYGREFGGVKVGHSYAARFGSAFEVAAYLADNKEFLTSTTRTWVDTWYDSTLPYWLLDRTMANTSTLATTTCYRHQDGRFWAWEGVGCCAGTCTHVWHYAQAVGRLFPEIERDQRERVDFGLALKENGEIGYRAMLTTSQGPAFDGQCGRILGAYREHLMSTDDAFLRRNWPAIKRAVQYLIDRDGDLDGILEGSQPNTLDASWYGKISFISSLYIAALRAGEAMARERGDQGFARTCSGIAQKGARNIRELFNGEFFIQLEDPEHQDVIGVGTGCYIDQIFGQTWAHWVSLGHIFDRGMQLVALRSLYRYNFVPDVGPFRRHFTAGRWYAMAGDGGLLMCTWPKGGKRDQWEEQWQFMYFNECMSGFEWQAASHMIFEGIDQPDLLQNGLVVSRAIHDRYNARLRNPYNEIECSDHYARAMASYGVFQAISGFFCHGPQGIIGFDPRLTPQDFKCAFVGPEGWGSWSQKSGNQFEARLETKYGRVSLREINLRIPAKYSRRKLEVTINGEVMPHKIEGDHNGLMAVRFARTDVKELRISG